MTNLQEGVKPPSPALRVGLLVGLPIAAGAVLSGLVFFGGIWQPWNTLRQDQIQLDELREMERRLPLLRVQRLRQIEETDKIRKQQSNLLQLIAGSGDFDTFMAQLNREASAAGIQLDVFEPVAPPAAPAPAEGAPPAAGQPADGQAADPNAPPPPPQDPLEASGLVKSTTLLSARGRYPNLLNFLRRLERLGLLVVQSDLNVVLREATGPATANALPLADLKLNLSLYREGEPAPAAAPEAPPGSPPPTPATPATPAPPATPNTP
jgi:type IV pilus assembly protein PilO